MQAIATDDIAPPSRVGWSIPATLLLVGFADYLILTTVPGIGWFIAIAVTATVIGGHALGRANTLQCLGAVSIGVIAALPFIEAPSLPALGVALLGLATSALLAAGLFPATIEAVPAVMLRFAALAPVRLLGDGIAGLAGRTGNGMGEAVRRHVLGWIVPIVFVAIFLWLFVAANPILDLAAAQLGGLSFPDPFRIVVWLVLAAGIWALLRPRLLPLLQLEPTTVAKEPGESLLFGRAVILRSLVIFNAVFAMQTLMDLTYLWGGVALPPGMSYADYAHRGAFPLIATTLLAAAFVLAAMRRDGPGMHSVLIRRLVYVWIGQNILLCVSSILRLDLYVEIYSLTELRVAAGIWMGLVAIGLLLILLRIALRKSNAWLIATNLTSLAVTLYGCAWIDFSAIIARFNIEHSREISGSGVSLDLPHLRDLGPAILPSLDAYIAQIEVTGGPVVHYKAHLIEAMSLRNDLASRFRQDTPEDWRGWSWRRERLAAYLDSADRNDDNQGNDAIVSQ